MRILPPTAMQNESGGGNQVCRYHRRRRNNELNCELVSKMVNRGL